MNTEQDSVIQISGLDKYFGKFQALDRLDLTVHQGEVMGFLGPNGSGKSTTIRVLLGLLKADSGSVKLLGGDPWKDVVSLHRRLAYVPGDVSLWPGMTGGEAIDLLGKLRGGLDKKRRASLIERFELDPTKRGRQYSKGNRQKVAIIAALASNVELLVLDEPTSGLDPLMESVFQDEILAEKKLGTSVLLSSHILSEAEALADRVSIIRDGKIVEVGTIEELRSHISTTVHAVLDRAPANLEAFTFMHQPQLDGMSLTGQVDRADLTQAMKVLSEFGVSNVTISPPSLEDLFLSQYAETSLQGQTNSHHAPRHAAPRHGKETA